MKKYLVYPLLCLLPYSLSCMADSTINFDFSGSAGLDSNVNQSPIGELEISDFTYNANAGISYSYKLLNSLISNVFTRADYNGFSDSEGLVNADFIAGVQLRYKPIMHYTSPTFILGLEGGSQDFSTDLRDSTHYQASFMASSWITDRMSARAGIRRKINDSESVVFDTEETRYFINSDLMFENKITGYATLSYIRGDITPTIPLSFQTSETVKLIVAADELQRDPTFGTSELTYRLQARTWVFQLGSNIALAKRKSVDASLMLITSKADEDISYSRIMFNVSYLARFMVH